MSQGRAGEIAMNWVYAQSFSVLRCLITIFSVVAMLVTSGPVRWSPDALTASIAVPTEPSPSSITRPAMHAIKRMPTKVFTAHPLYAIGARRKRWVYNVGALRLYNLEKQNLPVITSRTEFLTHGRSDRVRDAAQAIAEGKFKAKPAHSSVTSALTVLFARRKRSVSAACGSSGRYRTGRSG